jgi:zinc/manganese transport system substrate-binding protein
MHRRYLLAGGLSLAAALQGRGAHAQAKLKVVASFSILADLASAVAGDAAEIVAIVGPDVDAHGFEPSPSDARLLAGADVVVTVGLGFEGWMDRLVSSSGFKGRRVVASEGIATLRTKGHGHAHGHAGHSHGKGGVDPHVWQDPLRVQQMVRSIARGFGAADPSRAAIYDANAAAYVAKLGELDRWIVGELASVPAARRKIVTSHDAFAYFAARYGVEFRAPRGVNTESEPSAADLGRIIREIRRDKVKIVFLENISDPRMIEQVARESGAQMGGRLYSDALSRADGPAPTYLALMRHNVTRLRDAMRAE